MLKNGVWVVQSESLGGHQEKVTCLSPASAVKLSASHSVEELADTHKHLLGYNIGLTKVLWEHHFL